MLFFTELTQDDWPLAPGTVAILPLAAIEAHGPHLPLGTDQMIAEGIVDKAALALELMDRDQAAVMLPTLWLGTSAEHGDKPGTLSQDPEQLAAQIVATGIGLAEAGVDRLVLFSAHGGNRAAAEIAALRLRTEAGMLVATPHWSNFGLPEGFTPPAPKAGDVHGGWQETSIMLALRPDLVDMEKASDFSGKAPHALLFPEGSVNWGWMTSDINEIGAIGRADLATPMLGAALLDHFGPKLADLIIAMADADWAPEGDAP
ncbi:MAG: creatininase family protein [Pseudomonadota bacterium]